MSDSYERLRAAADAGEPALTIELGKLYLARHPEDFSALMRYGMALEHVARYAEALGIWTTYRIAAAG